MTKVKLFLIGLAVVSFCFTLPAYASQDEIVIGCLYGITGTYSAMSKMQKEGVDMAVSDLNAAGGVLGKQIKVIYEDTETKPDVGTRKAERLILREKVDFLISSVSSNITLSVMEIAKKYNKILMVSMSQSIKITGSHKNKQTFRVCANPTITASALCEYMTKNYGNKVYMLTVDYAWGRSTSETYHDVLKSLNANFLGETFFPLGTKDFASYFGKIKAAKPDVLFITAGGNDAISVVAQADQYGIKDMMAISGDGSLVSSDVVSAMGDSATGIITADYYAASLDTPANKKWAKRYEDLYNSKPSKFSVSSYESVMWLAQAIQAAGTTESDKVISSLEESTYDGPQGVKTMNPENHQTSLSVYMIRIENGERKIFAKN